MKASCSTNSLWNDLVQLGSASCPGTAELLSERPDRLVVRVGSTVVKAHEAGTPAAELAARLQLVQAAPLNEIFLEPLSPAVHPLAEQRLATLWPLGQAIRELEEAPWAEAARLLARLHQVPLPALPLPKYRAVERMLYALSQLDDCDPFDPKVQSVRAAAESLTIPADRSSSLVHGDWHFGQMVLGSQGWRLIDVDDLGVGNPAWDLARPAAFYAAGLIAHELWECFLESYRAAGGPAVPARGNPWVTLDLPARALVVQCAAAALVRAHRSQEPLQEAEWPLIESCQRLVNF